MSKEEFLENLKKALPLIKKSEKITIVHHNDADGLSSGAILKAALERAGHDVENVPIERVHPLIVKRIFELYDNLILFCDLGSRAAPEIARINNGKNHVVIIDHHLPSRVDDPKVFNFSTEFYGVSGEKDISAASAAYLFANLLGDNRDLAYLGVIGAIGDSHHRFGYLMGVNREVLEEAVKAGQVEILKKDGKEVYILTVFGERLPISKFAKNLTVLGAVGYYLDGPEIGIEMCLKGPSEKSGKRLEELDRIKREKFEKALDELNSGRLIQTKYVQWFHVHDDFEPMGVKVIGEFCMEIRTRKFINPNKYIAGFQNMPPSVPKLGKFDWNIAKLSMRVPPSLEEKIVSREMPGLAWLLPEAAKRVGGDIDACHDYAAATTLDIGKEEKLIEELNKLVEERVRD